MRLQENCKHNSLKILCYVLNTSFLVAFEILMLFQSSSHFAAFFPFQQSYLKQTNSLLKIDLLPAWKCIKCFFVHLENLLEAEPRRNVFHYPNISKTESEQHCPVTI